MVWKWNDVDDILHSMSPGAQTGLTPLAKFAANLALQLPALRGDEIRITGIFAILGKLRLREEVVEADLADAAAEFQARVPTLPFGRKNLRAG
jgi:hypothetical protein